MLHYKEKRKKLNKFITGFHNKPQGNGAFVASAAGPFTTKKETNKTRECSQCKKTILLKLCMYIDAVYYEQYRDM
jgi:hypothetical protein